MGLRAKVGEEANRQEDSIAEGVRNEEKCRYANIEMTSEERALRKIPSSYNENPDVSADEKARGNREREDHMAIRTLTEAEGCDSVLLICGSMHSDALAKSFRTRGHSVEIDDLQRQDWYVEDWMNHVMHNL
jgi:hypothetical protein